MAAKSACVGWAGMVGVGVGGGVAGMAGDVDGGCVRRDFSVVRSGRALGAALTAVWRGLGGVDGFTFGWRGRFARGRGASGGGFEGVVGDGKLGGSVPWLVEAFQCMLMGGVTWRSERSGRRSGASEVVGIVGDGKGCDGNGCAVAAKDENVGEVCGVGGGVDVEGNAA